MQIKEYKVDKRKWSWRNLKTIFGLLGLALLFFIIYRIQLQQSYLWFSRVYIFIAVFLTGAAFLGRRPGISFGKDSLCLGKKTLPYSRIEKIQVSKDHLDVLTADRESFKLNLKFYSKQDRGEILTILDKILEGRVADMAVEADRRFTAGGNEGLEFSFTEKHSRFWLPMFIAMVVFGTISIIIMAVLAVMADSVELLTNLILWYAAPLVVLALFCRWADKTVPKKTVTFRDDTFSISKGDKILYRFRTEQLRNVGIENLNRYISFHVPECRRKEIKLLKICFNFKEWAIMLDRVKRIFYFPAKQVES